MRIKSSAYTIFFPLVPNIRESIFEFEEQLGDFMKPFTLLPVPNEAPAEIPRIGAFSEQDRSSLLVTAQSAAITVGYDQATGRDIEKCFQCIEGKKETLIAAYDRILQPKTRAGILFSGLATEIEFTEDAVADPASFIYDNFVKIDSEQKAHDISIRLTHVLQDSMYVNMEIRNVRLFSGMRFGGPISTVGMSQRSHSLFVNLDVNDKYSYDSTPGYTTDKERTKEVFSVSKRIASEKLHALIFEGGKLNYDY